MLSKLKLKKNLFWIGINIKNGGIYGSIFFPGSYAYLYSVFFLTFYGGLVDKKLSY